MKRWLYRSCVPVICLVILAGCQKNVDSTTEPVYGSNYFVSATSAGSFTKDILQTVARANGFGEFVSLIKYDVDFVKLVYKTSYNGKPIEASGLVAIPKNTLVPPSILSAQHGTIIKFADAPSNFPSATTGFELFGSAGYVTVIPDFIGFGVSKNIVHPYYDQKHSGTAVVDMLKAVKFYLLKEKIATSNRLFLFGYSEGGYVTMAAQKEIETHPDINLPITAAAEGAGGYDLTTMLSGIAAMPTYAEPAYLAFILQSYNTTYSWNRSYNEFFQEPYASKIPALLNGDKSLTDINAALTTSTAALLNPIFLANIQNAAGEPVLKQALRNNSFLDWVPASRTRLYHGTADVTVLYETSVTTFNRFKAAGATNVTFISIPGGNHQTSIKPTIQDALSWFQSLDK